MPTSPWTAAASPAACLALALALAACRQQPGSEQQPAGAQQPTAEAADVVANAGPAPVDEAAPAAPAPPAAAAESNQAAPAKATAPAARKPWSASGYTLSGTEPFWGGTVTGSRIVYQTPEYQAGKSIPATAELGETRETYAGRLGGKPFRLTLTKGACSNGMSDRQFAFTAALTVAGETRQGCADPK